MTTSPAGDPSGQPARPRDSRATTWMIVSGVLALVAIGLGIWAFTTKSDLDDANDQLETQQQQAASDEQSAQSTEERLQSFGERERAAFERVKRRFIREKAQARSLRASVNKEAGELDAARKEVSSAQGQDQKEAASLKAAREEVQLASACVQGAVNALDRFFNAPNPKAGAKAAVAELESIQSQCTKANSG